MGSLLAIKNVIQEEFQLKSSRRGKYEGARIGYFKFVDLE